MDALSIPVAGAATGVVLLGVIHLRGGASRPLVSRELRFGADLTAEVVIAALVAVSGLPRGSRVTLDVTADVHGIRHALHADRATLDSLSAQLRGLLPSLRLMPDEQPQPVWTHGAALQWTGSHVLLRTDQIDEVTAALLGVLAPLAPNEAIRLSWTLTPTRRPRLPRRQAADARPGLLEHVLHGSAPARDDHRAIRIKYVGPLLSVRGLLAVRAGDPRRAAHLLGRVVAVIRARRGATGALRARRVNASRLAAEPSTTRGGDLYAPAELAGLLGWPIGAPQLPGLSLGTAPQLVPSPRIPARGRVLARSTWPGQDRALAQPLLGAMSHTLIAGPTGVGKSALLLNLIVQDLRAGRGCLLLDGKGDLAADVLARVPECRVDEVIVLDPAHGGPLPGLRVFGGGSDPELAADLVLGVFRDLFADAWGPRSEQWMRAGLVTLAHSDATTLADLPFLFADAGYRRRLVGRLSDPLLLGTWAGFEAMSAAERASQLAAPLNKLDQLIGRKAVRTILAQSSAGLDLHEALRRGQVVIVSLAPGRIGAPAARLIGALVVYQLFTAVQARAALPASARRPFLAYIDEPTVLGDLPVPLDSLLELGRGFGVGLTLAAQSVTQLPKPVQRALLTNAATLVAFRQGADDAHLLARELPPVSAEALQHLPAFEVVARVGLGPGDVAPVATGRTLPVPKPTSDPASIRRASAERFGVDPDAVDAALRARHQQPPDDGPVGRTRRAQ